MSFYRGNRVFFKNISFTDEDGSTFVASSATMTLHYRNVSSGRETSSTVTLTLQGDNTWQGSWDSSVAKEGFIEGVLTGVGTNGDGDAITAVKDFKFKLTANNANEALNG